MYLIIQNLTMIRKKKLELDSKNFIYFLFSKYLSIKVIKFCDSFDSFAIQLSQKRFMNEYSAH